ncbi:hypothetical protein [Gordonia sp. (in: high G+C Gram-positive bacteria)]|uniref:hypothetical protein n=1 Tax=Gordonia sp. (in: high G+C Gram-positive bacteria) TaxID=84139 RepID=UPI0025BCB0BF|nr:hypothetical protein [Gordonia sp. (in: high G+C Gram-positive bacteria)]HMS77472.1 hypothetical protein [Gordonia sp. (in: high G+C Gram-positive bacteria)]
MDVVLDPVICRNNRIAERTWRPAYCRYRSAEQRSGGTREIFDDLEEFTTRTRSVGTP